MCTQQRVVVTYQDPLGLEFDSCVNLPILWAILWTEVSPAQ